MVGSSPVLIYNTPQFAYSAGFKLFPDHKQPILGVRDPATFGAALKLLDQSGMDCLSVIHTRAGTPPYAQESRVVKGSDSFGEIVVDQVCKAALPAGR